MPEVLTFEQFAARYCERQESESEQLLYTLRGQQAAYGPEGWMLLECQMLDSSHLGTLTILPFGPRNTFKAPPEGPISPRELASDMSSVVAILPAANLPN